MIVARRTTAPAAKPLAGLGFVARVRVSVDIGWSVPGFVRCRL